MSYLKPESTTSASSTTVSVEVQGVSPRDERLAIPIDPEAALRGLMQSGPHREPDAD
jgi:hypothetical protein